MLMVIILTWGRELIMRSVESVQYVHDLKRRLQLDNTDYIICDTSFLCPIIFDHAFRELTESEQIEWLMTEVYPNLVAEQRMLKIRGKYKNVAGLSIVENS